MSLWCDEKYLKLLSPQLDRFQKRGPRLYSFRCPFCGDSAVNKLKTRGYMFPKKQLFMYKCHNCGLALPFGAFLKRLNRTLYSEYVLENFDGKHPAPESVNPQVDPKLFTPTRVFFSSPHLVVLSSPNLGDVECVRDYVRGRQLPDTALTRLYASNTAKTWLTEHVGEEKCAAILDGVPYLVIPLRLANGDWYGAQLRTLDRKEYLTFRWAHDELQRTFGLEKWNPLDLTYCVEGPLDALCAPNAIAFCGSDILAGVDRLAEAGLTIDKLVLVWDNEPRNPHIVRHMKDAIAAGHTVFIWPKGYPKDLNDCRAAGIDVPHLLATHTYSGLRAELEFTQFQRP